MSNEIIDLIQTQILTLSRRRPSGWFSVNCPACIFNGEPSPDRRFRGGFKIENDFVVYRCFRCNYKAFYKSGSILNYKMKKLLTYFNINKELIDEISFKSWSIFEKNYDIQNLNKEKKELEEFSFTPEFKEKELPKGSKNIFYLLENGFKDNDFLDCLQYLYDRGEIILTSHNYYWCPSRKYRRSIIIPFYFKDKIVGFSSRRIDANKNKKIPKYYTEVDKDFIFNNNLLYSNRKYIIIVEGIFDAISIEGISVLGNHITENQLMWIKSSNKIPIVLPDKDKAGNNLIKEALKNNWLISYPKYFNFDNDIWYWDNNIKDAADAVKEYGKLFTLRSIFESIITPEEYLRLEIIMRLEKR